MRQVRGTVTHAAGEFDRFQLVASIGHHRRVFDGWNQRLLIIFWLDPVVIAHDEAMLRNGESEIFELRRHNVNASDLWYREDRNFQRRHKDTLSLARLTRLPGI